MSRQSELTSVTDLISSVAELMKPAILNPAKPTLISLMPDPAANGANDRTMNAPVHANNPCTTNTLSIDAIA